MAGSRCGCRPKEASKRAQVARKPWCVRGVVRIHHCCTAQEATTRAAYTCALAIWAGRLAGRWYAAEPQSGSGLSVNDGEARTSVRGLMGVHRGRLLRHVRLRRRRCCAPDATTPESGQEYGARSPHWAAIVTNSRRRTLSGGVYRAYGPLSAWPSSVSWYLVISMILSSMLTAVNEV